MAVQPSALAYLTFRWAGVAWNTGRTAYLSLLLHHQGWTQKVRWGVRDLTRYVTLTRRGPRLASWPIDSVIAGEPVFLGHMDHLPVHSAAEFNHSACDIR